MGMQGGFGLRTRGAIIGVVGDFNPANETHRLTNEALSALSPPLHYTWIGTDQVPKAPEALLAYDGLLIAPASPYRDMEGALRAIRTARERGLPLLGT